MGGIPIGESGLGVEDGVGGGLSGVVRDVGERSYLGLNVGKGAVQLVLLADGVSSSEIKVRWRGTLSGTSFFCRYILQ